MVRTIAAIFVFLAALVFLGQLYVLLALDDESAFEMSRAYLLWSSKTGKDPSLRGMTEAQVDQVLAQHKGEILKNIQGSSGTMKAMKTIIAVGLIVVGIGLLTFNRGLAKPAAIIVMILLLLGTLGKIASKDDDMGFYDHVKNWTSQLTLSKTVDSCMWPALIIGLAVSITALMNFMWVKPAEAKEFGSPRGPGLG